MTAFAVQAVQRAVARRRLAVTPAVEVLVLAVAAAIGVASYLVLRSGSDPTRLISSPLIALLLVANILPGVIILMLIGRRIARRRAARSPVGGRGQLHVRLVAMPWLGDSCKDLNLKSSYNVSCSHIHSY